MALIVAAVLLVLVGSIGIVVTPVAREQNVCGYGKPRLTTRHSSRRSHSQPLAGAGDHSLGAARHAVDIPVGHNSLDCVRLGNMSLWLVVHGRSHHRSGLEGGPT